MVVSDRCLSIQSLPLFWGVCFSAPVVLNSFFHSLGWVVGQLQYQVVPAGDAEQQ